MADQTTTTKSGSTRARKKEALGDRVERLMDELREALIEAGRDETTVDAQLYGLRVPETNVVGNLADLQRMGAGVAAGATPAKALEEAVVLEPIQAPASPEEG